MDFRIAEGRDVAVALQALLVEVHRQGDVDGDHELQVDGESLGQDCVAGHMAAAASTAAQRQKPQHYRQGIRHVPQSGTGAIWLKVSSAWTANRRAWLAKIWL